MPSLLISKIIFILSQIAFKGESPPKFVHYFFGGEGVQLLHCNSDILANAKSAEDSVCFPFSIFITIACSY